MTRGQGPCRARSCSVPAGCRGLMTRVFGWLHLPGGRQASKGAETMVAHHEARGPARPGSQAGLNRSVSSAGMEQGAGSPSAAGLSCLPPMRVAVRKEPGHRAGDRRPGRASRRRAAAGGGQDREQGRSLPRIRVTSPRRRQKDELSRRPAPTDQCRNSSAATRRVGCTAARKPTDPGCGSSAPTGASGVSEPAGLPRTNATSGIWPLRRDQSGGRAGSH
jgi:hypothetical protein